MGFDVLLRIAPLLGAGCILVASATGDVIRVPEDYSTINAAVDVAVVGDSVLVGPGTWTGEQRVVQICTNVLNIHSVVFMKPGITVVGTGGPDVTILDGGPAVSAAVETVLHPSLDGPSSRIQGFTITGGMNGVIIGCADTHIDVVDCRIIDNPGRALNLAESSMTVEDCVVSRNGSNGVPAVFSSRDTDFEAINTRFENHSTLVMNLLDPDRVLIDGCEFVDNSPGGALTVHSCPDVTVRNSVFLRNRKDSVGGAIQMTASMATIEFNTFAYDSTTGFNAGGAINVSTTSSATIRNNTFYACNAGAGAGIAVSASIATVNNNIFTACIGDALAQFSGSTVRVPQSGCNLLWNNTEDYRNWDEAAMATDIHLDPELCDPEFLDFTVRSSSPALAQNSGGCGAIGAHGIGCGSVSVEATSWGHIKGLYRAPVEGR